MEHRIHPSLLQYYSTPFTNFYKLLQTLVEVNKPGEKEDWPVVGPNAWGKQYHLPFHITFIGKKQESQHGVSQLSFIDHPTVSS